LNKNDKNTSTVLLNLQSYEAVIKTIEESNDVDKHIVIDNTPYPPSGITRKYSNKTITHFS